MKVFVDEYHISQQYLILEFRDGKYLFDGRDVIEKRGNIECLFWIENYGHARFGMSFLDAIIKDHRNGRQIVCPGKSYTSCRETLSLDFFPWNSKEILIQRRPKKIRRQKTHFKIDHLHKFSENKFFK